jgi:hypothetical protein
VGKLICLEQDPTIIANGLCDTDIRILLLKISPAEQEHKCVKTKPYRASSFHIERRKTEREGREVDGLCNQAQNDSKKAWSSFPHKVLPPTGMGSLESSTIVATVPAHHNLPPATLHIP